MDRREFLTASLGTTAFVTSASSQPAGSGDSEKIPGQTPSPTVSLVGKPLEGLRERYHHDLFDDFLPFMDRYVVDREFGGFMCNTARDGTNLSQTKNSWYEGRGIWAYSFLYNSLEKKEEYLEVARKSVDFVLRVKPEDPHGLWPRSFSRERKPLGEPRPEVYGNLFIAEGLAEFSKATADREYWDTAREIVKAAVDVYDRTDYCPVIGQTYLGSEAPPFPGARILGHWMVLIRVATQMLRIHADPWLEDLAARSVDAIMNHHHNPRFDLTNELINHDLSRPDDDYEQLVYTGHAIETLWMVMDEAVRLRDRGLFEEAARRFRRHVEVAWDDVYGGVFRNLQHVDRNIWSLDKVLWAQEEVLIGALMAIEHLGSDWATEMFTKTYDYVMEKYPLKKHGYSLWILGADRKVTYEEKASRVGNYHHPRHLMLNLLSIERIVERGGAASGIFG